MATDLTAPSVRTDRHDGVPSNFAPLEVAVLVHCYNEGRRETHHGDGYVEAGIVPRRPTGEERRRS